MFNDRQDAGERLANLLEKYKDSDGVVLAVPRGGVVLGRVVADRLGWPLDLVITRKVGHPDNPEYALCVVAEDGHMVGENREISAVDQGWLAMEKDKEMAEARRRREVYLAGRERAEIAGKVVVVVDDGVATGWTILGALKEVKEKQPKKLIAAIPVMPAEFEDDFLGVADEVVCVHKDEQYLGAVGAYYNYFPQVTDEEVINLLKTK